MDDFTLTDEEAEALRQLAALEPLEARRWLQDRPALAQRMTSWPPEIRLEIVRILYRSFPQEQRDAARERSRRGTGLVDQIEQADRTPVADDPRPRRPGVP